jgi:hypothetical protein
MSTVYFVPRGWYRVKRVPENVLVTIVDLGDTGKPIASHGEPASDFIKEGDICIKFHTTIGRSFFVNLKNLVGWQTGDKKYPVNNIELERVSDNHFYEKMIATPTS